MATPVVNANAGASARIRVGDWEIDPALNELRRDGEAVRLEPKVAELLLKLTQRPGEVCSREELLAAVWSGVVVGDDALTQAIIKLRKAMGDDAHKPIYIETISKRGYRLIAPVAVDTPGASRAGALPKQDAPASERPARRRRLSLGAIAALVLLGAIIALLVAKHPMPWPIHEGASSQPAVIGPDPFSVAVLPFAPASPAPEDERVAAQLTQEVISAVEAKRLSPVVAYGRVTKYIGQAVEPRAVGRDLNVRYLLEGAVRKEGDGAVVVGRLVETGRGTQVWSGSISVPASTGPTRTVALFDATRAFRGAIYEAEKKRVSEMPVANASAKEIALRADVLVDNDPSLAGALAARKLYEEALRKDPAWTGALVGLYNTLRTELYEDGKADQDRLVKEMEAVSLRAVRADRTDARAWLMRSDALQHLYQWDGAFAANEEARRIDPNRSGVHMDLAELLLETGRAEEVFAVAQKGIDLDPRSPALGGLLFRMCRAHLFLGRYDEAITTCQKGIALDNEYWWFAHLLMVAAYGQKGDAAKASEHRAELLRRRPWITIDYLRSRRSSNHPTYRLQQEAQLFAGLRKAGVPERLGSHGDVKPPESAP